MYIPLRLIGAYRKEEHHMNASLLQEHVPGFDWPQLVLVGVTGIALLLGVARLFQEDALLRGRGVVIVTTGFFIGSWLLVTTPEAFGSSVSAGASVPVVAFTAALLVVAISTQRWRR